MDVEEEVGQNEVEAMVDVAEGSDSDEEDQLAEGTMGASAPVLRQWPEVSTATAKRYQHEVDQIRECFEDAVDMFDTTMVSEYSEEIFEYMSKLEVSFVSFHGLHLIHSGFYVGGDYAQRRLHLRAKRNYMGNASDSRRLVAASAPAVSHAPRNALDRSQHRRPVSYQACCVRDQAAARWRDGYVHRCEV